MNFDNKEDLRQLDHLNKCRCCFEKFDHIGNQVEITEIIEEQFLELTQIELKSSPSYSKSVCLKCTKELQSISNFRLDLITKQQKLYDFVTTCEYEIQDNVRFELVNVKNETQSSDELDSLFEYESQSEVPVSEADNQSPKTQCSFSELKDNEPKNEIKVKKKALTKIKTKVKKVQPKEPKKSQVSNKVNCPQCDILLCSSAYLKRHLRNVHGLINEDDIKKRSPKKLQIKTSTTQTQIIVEKVHEKAICPHCGILLKSSALLKRHIERVHLKMKLYFCDSCNFGTRDKHDLKNHVKIHIPTQFREKFYCDQCDKVTFTRNCLNTHKKIAHPIDDTKYECHCGKKFALIGQLNYHKKNYHGNHQKKIKPKNICTICEKVYSTPSKLKEHMIYHTAKRDVTCEVCGKMFLTLRQLTHHSMYHKDKQFVCSFDGCAKKFFTLTALEGHKKKHIGQRDYACHLCDKKYFAADHLLRHDTHFHKKLKFTCELPGCSSLTFVRKESYRSHVLKYHTELSEEKKQLLLKKIREMKLV